MNITVRKYRQVSGHSGAQEETVCKTVGSAYDGSNPSPATVCENGPWPGISLTSWAVVRCVTLCHHRSGDVATRRWLRTNSGRDPGRRSGSPNRLLFPGCGDHPARRRRPCRGRRASRWPPGAARGWPREPPEGAAPILMVASRHELPPEAALVGAAVVHRVTSPRDGRATSAWLARPAVARDRSALGPAGPR